MIWYELTARATDRRGDIRARIFTKSRRKAEAWARLPKIQFTDSGHGIVFGFEERSGVSGQQRNELGYRWDEKAGEWGR